MEMGNNNLIQIDNRNTISVKESGLEIVMATRNNGPGDYGSGLYFSENTNFYLEGKDVIYYDYRHGLDDTFKSKTIAKATNIRDTGTAIIGDLYVLDEFKGTEIEKKILSGELFSSPLTHPSKMKYNKETGEILEWDFLNGGLTPNPDLKTKDTKIKHVMTIKEFTDAFNDEGTTDAGLSAKSNEGGSIMEFSDVLGWFKDKPDKLKEVVLKSDEYDTMKEEAEAKDKRIAELEAEIATLKEAKSKKEEDLKTTTEGNDQLTKTVKELADLVKTYKEQVETYKADAADSKAVLNAFKEYVENGKKEDSSGGEGDKIETFADIWAKGGKA